LKVAIVGRYAVDGLPVFTVVTHYNPEAVGEWISIEQTQAIALMEMLVQLTCLYS